MQVFDTEAIFLAFEDPVARELALTAGIIGAQMSRIAAWALAGLSLGVTSSADAGEGADAGADDPGATFAELTHAAQGARAIARVAVSATLPSDHPTGRPRAFQPIEDPSLHAFDDFYAALARTDAGDVGAMTRVIHMGDSSIGHDGLPHAIRRRLQDRFGDGGPGFLLLTRYSPNYASKVARFSSRGKWDVCYIAYLCRSDGHYGLGGHVFRGGPGASATVKTRAKGRYGANASHFELWYATSPRGGRATFRVNRGSAVVLDTRAEAVGSRWARLHTTLGANQATLRVESGPYVWAYGVVLETDGPGIVWDTMSMIGAYTKRLHGFDADHIAEQVKHRDANLLVLNYGGNDLRRLVTGRVNTEQYEAELSATIALLRRGKPAMSCLVVGVIDHGRSGDASVTRSHIKAMVSTQRRAAFGNGCAFFDSVAAMGGPGSIRKWKRRRPALAAPDLKHLTQAGRALMGARIVAALLAGYEAQLPPVP